MSCQQNPVTVRHLAGGRVAAVPKGAIAKPAYGSPCNGCGACCLAVVCPAGMAIMKLPSRLLSCPALTVRENGSYVCGLVANPALYAPKETAEHGVEAMSRAARDLIGADLGCDAPTALESQHPDYAKWRGAIDAASLKLSEPRARARKLWGRT